MKRKIFPILVAILMLCTSCSSASLDNASKELGDAIANVADSDNKHVQMVKNGYREINPDITYDMAFTSFFGTPRWKYFNGEDGQDVVEFTGDCTYLDAPVKARIQFVVDEKNGTFEATYLAFNEVPQGMLIFATLIEKAFESADEQMQTESVMPASTTYQGELLYNGMPILSWVGRNGKDLYGELGTPEYEDYGMDDYEYSYEDIVFLGKEEIKGIQGLNPSIFSIDGITLDKNKDELLDIFGEPIEENDTEDSGYYVYYEYQDYNVTFLFNDPKDMASCFWFWAPYAFDYGDDAESLTDSIEDFGLAVMFDDLSIVFHNQYRIGKFANLDKDSAKQAICIFPIVTNSGKSPSTLNQNDVTIYGPNGTQLIPYKDYYIDNVFFTGQPGQSRGNILSGATQKLCILIPYVGDGNYVVYYQNYSSETSVTLPIKRSKSMDIDGLLGKWVFDNGSGTGVYDTFNIHAIEFYDDGTGAFHIKERDNIRIIDTTWYVNYATNGMIALAIKGENNTFVSSYSIVNDTLVLEKTSISIVRVSGWDIQTGIDYYEGADRFLRYIE